MATYCPRNWTFLLLVLHAISPLVVGASRNVTVTFQSDGRESSVSYAILPLDLIHGELNWVNPPIASSYGPYTFSFNTSFPDGVYYVRRSDPFGDGGGSVSVVGLDGTVYLQQDLDFGFLDYDWFVIGEPNNILRVTFETFCDDSPFESSWRLFLPAYSAYLFDKPIQCMSPNETIVTDAVLYEGLARIDMEDSSGDGISRLDVPWFISVSFSPYNAGTEAWEEKALNLPYEVGDNEEGTSYSALVSLMYEEDGAATDHSVLISAVCTCYYCYGEVIISSEDSDVTSSLEIDCESTYDALRRPGEEDYNIYDYCYDDGKTCVMVFWTSTWQYVRYVAFEELSMEVHVPADSTVRVEVTDWYTLGRLNIDVIDVIEENDYLLLSTGGSYTFEGYFEVFLDESYIEPSASIDPEDSVSESDLDASYMPPLHDNLSLFNFSTCVPISSNDVEETEETTFSVSENVREYVIYASVDPIYDDVAWGMFDNTSTPVLWSHEENVENSFCTSSITSSPVPVPEDLVLNFNGPGETMSCHVQLDPGQTYTLTRRDLWRDGGVSVLIFDEASGALVKRFDPYEYAGYDEDWHTIDFSVSTADDCSWPATGCLGDVMACLSCNTRVYDLSNKEFVTDGVCNDGSAYATQCFSSKSKSLYGVVSPDIASGVVENNKEQWTVQGGGVAWEGGLQLILMFQTGTASTTHIALVSCDSDVLWRITGPVGVVHAEETMSCSAESSYGLLYMSTAGTYTAHSEAVDGTGAVFSIVVLDVVTNDTVFADHRTVNGAADVSFDFSGKVTHTLEVTTESEFMWSILKWDTNEVVAENSSESSSSNSITTEFSLSLEQGDYVIRWFNVEQIYLWTATGERVLHIEYGFFSYGDGACGMRPFSVGHDGTVHEVLFINACQDDACEHLNSGYVDINSDVLLLGENADFALEYGGYGQITGLRFEDLRVPRGSTINNAYIRFRAAELSWTTRALSLSIRGETGLSPLFSSLKGDLSSRPLTNSNVTWNAEELQSGEVYHTTSLKKIVEEIVSGDTWESGFPLSFFMQGTGTGGMVSRDVGGQCWTLEQSSAVVSTVGECVQKWDAPALFVEYTPVESEDTEPTVCENCECDVSCEEDGTCACGSATDVEGREVMLLGDRCEIPFRQSTGTHHVTVFLVNVAHDNLDDSGEGCAYVTPVDRSGGPSCSLRGAVSRANSIVEQDDDGQIVVIVVRESLTPKITLNKRIKVQGTGSGDAFRNAIFITGSPGNASFFDDPVLDDDVANPRGMPIIVGPRFSRHFYVSNIYLHASNLVFQNGYAPPYVGTGGSMYIYIASVMLRHCLFRWNRADWLGGGVYVSDDSSLVVSGSRFASNSVQSYGSAICVLHASSLVEDSVFCDNFGASAIYQYGSGETTYDEDITFGDPGYTHVRRSSFVRNNGVQTGGGILAEAQLSMEGSNFTDNVSLYGGGVRCHGGVLLVSESNFTSNTAQNGGGIFAETCAVHVDAATFESNHAMAGGGISVVDGSQLVVTDSTFDSNVAAADSYMSLESLKDTMGCGGGICVGRKDFTSADSNSSLLVIGCEFHDNTDDLSLAYAVGGKDKYHASICADVAYDLRTTVLDAADTRAMSVDQHFPGCEAGACEEGCLDLNGSLEHHGMFGVLCECERRTSCEMTPFELARLETLAMENDAPAEATFRYLKLESSVSQPFVDTLYAHMDGCGEVRWGVSLLSNVTWLDVGPLGWFDLNRHQCDEFGSGLDEYQAIDLSFEVAGLTSGFYEALLNVTYHLYNPTKMEFFPYSEYLININLDLYTPIEPANSEFTGPYRVETYDLADAQVFMSALADLTYERMPGNYAVNGDLVFYLLKAFDCEGLRESGDSEVYFEMTENNATKVVSTRNYGDGTYACFFRVPVRPYTVWVRNMYRNEQGEEMDVELHEYEETAIECAGGFVWTGVQCEEEESSAMSVQLIVLITMLSASALVVIYMVRKKADVARRVLLKLMKDTFIITLSLIADAIDILTDVVAFFAVQSDDSLERFHLPYLIILCLSLAVSVTSLALSSRILYRMSHNNHIVVPDNLIVPQEDPEKDLSANPAGPEGRGPVLPSRNSKTRLQAESLLRSAYGRRDTADADVDVELHSEIRDVRNNIQRNYMKLIVACVEDVPMLVINFLVELTTDESSKLEVRLSMLFTCFMMGFKSNAFLNIRRLRLQREVLEEYAAQRAAQMKNVN
eukprot:Rmarinus@m.7176